MSALSALSALKSSGRQRRRERAGDRQVLFPLRLVPLEKIEKWELFGADDGNNLAVETREYHIPDFSSWKDDDKFEAAFARLLADLK